MYLNSGCLIVPTIYLIATLVYIFCASEPNWLYLSVVCNIVIGLIGAAALFDYWERR